MFIWAWGINGCFSVVGAAARPDRRHRVRPLRRARGERARLSPRDPRIVRRLPAAPRRQGAGAGMRASGGDRRRAPLIAAVVAGATHACGGQRRGQPSMRAGRHRLPRRKWTMSTSTTRPSPIAGSSRKRTFRFSTQSTGRGAATPRRARERSIGKTRNTRTGTPSSISRPGSISRSRRSSWSSSTATTPRSPATWSPASKSPDSSPSPGSTRCWSRRNSRVDALEFELGELLDARRLRELPRRGHEQDGRGLRPAKTPAPSSRACRW